MTPTWTGNGYYLVASDGGIFTFGPDATFHGSTGAIHLNKPIVAMGLDNTGQGYWLTASDGGVFSFGDASFQGSAGGTHLNQPIVGMAVVSPPIDFVTNLTPAPDGHGYWLGTSGGGVFPYGDAVDHGSNLDALLSNPIAGIAATADGGGYWQADTTGHVFTFGDAPSLGSINDPDGVEGIVPTPDKGGYWLFDTRGGVFPFGDTRLLWISGPYETQPADHRYGEHARRPGVLAGGLRRRHFRLRGCSDSSDRPETCIFLRRSSGWRRRPTGTGCWERTDRSTRSRTTGPFGSPRRCSGASMVSHEHHLDNRRPGLLDH